MIKPDHRFQAMIVHNGRIVLTGTNDEICRYDAREVVDLNGKTVLPGFIDTHCQIPEMIDDTRKVNLKSAESIEEALSMLSEAAKHVKSDKWLIGRGISSKKLKEGRYPDRWELDKVSRNIPIYITSFDGHTILGNSRLLEVTGIDSSYVCESGEVVDFNEKNEPTGIFHELTIVKKLLSFCPPLYSDDNECREAIEVFLRNHTKLGYTTLHSIFGNRPSQLLRADYFIQLEKNNKLPLRINMCWNGFYENRMKIISGMGNNMLKIGPVKFLADGAIAEDTAFISQEYRDRPGTYGYLTEKEEILTEKITKAYKLGNNVCIHIIGDAALDYVIRLIKQIMDPERNNRFELIHCAVARPDQIEELKKLPVVVLKQPIFIQAPNTLHGEEKLGELNQYYHSIKSFLDAGLIVSGGTDGPLSDMNPFAGIQAAVTRRSEDGKVTVNPQECISVYDAVKMFTVNGSYSNYEENLKGTLEEGKLADFIVTDKNIFETEPQEIRNIRVEATYVGGKSCF
ncbi:MAG: amidohydrolase [Clostridiales bacterium]|nr:amidohydrolase [Clostridiales bacterium]